MKKLIMYVIGTIFVFSLSACTPTPVAKTETPEVDVEMSTGGAGDKLPDPNVEPMEIVSVYSIKQDKSGLIQAMDAVSVLDAQSVVDKLIEYKVLPEGTTALSFEMDNRTATLDLSQLPEENRDIAVISIGNTFIENFELDQVKLMVGGQEYAGKDGTGVLLYLKEYDIFK